MEKCEEPEEGKSLVREPEKSEEKKEEKVEEPQEPELTTAEEQILTAKLQRKAERHAERCRLKVLARREESKELVKAMEVPSQVNMRYEARKHPGVAGWAAPIHTIIARWQRNGKMQSGSVNFTYKLDDDVEFKNKIEKAISEVLTKFRSINSLRQGAGFSINS